MQNFNVVRSVRVYGYGSVMLLSRDDPSMFLVAVKKTRYSYYTFKVREDAESYFNILISDALPINDELYIKADSACSTLEHALEPFENAHIFKLKEKPAGNLISPTYLWHGTTADNMCRIISGGFKLPASPGGLMFGAGIYFAKDIKKSLAHTGKDIKCLLLCEVALGNSLILTSGKEYHKCPEGYDSVHGVGRTTDRESELEYDEYVVYNPKQIKVKYAVIFLAKHPDALGHES